MRKPSAPYTTKEIEFINEVMTKLPKDLPDNRKRGLAEYILAVNHLVDIYINNGWVSAAKNLEITHLAPMWHRVKDG